MKSIHLFLTVIAFLVGAQSLSAMKDEIPVPITEDEEEGTPIIRVPSFLRIDCLYDTDYFSFIFIISGNSDSIAVSIERIGTTESYETDLIGNGLFYVPISGNSGLWHITLSGQNGSEYTGEIQL